MTRLFELNTPLRSCTAVASQPRSNNAPGRCHRCMQRRATMPRVPPEEPPARGVLNLELEDEKESDRHRRRQQQSRDDPGAKACEATCVCCVGLLFFQVAWIVYTYGLDGTVGLLMAPEAPLRASGHVSSYRAASPPPGYGERVVVVQDDAARTQRIHYSTDGGARVVLYDAGERSTRWLFYSATQASELAACFVSYNDTALAYGLLPPSETFGRHGSFTALPEGAHAPAPPDYDPQACVPFTPRAPAGTEWRAATWPVERDAPHGHWCGAGRGGYTDCCSGEACAACVADGDGEAPSETCLKQCPPVDAMDGACARHAACQAARTASAQAAARAACACDRQLDIALPSLQCAAEHSGCVAHKERMSLRLGDGNAACWKERHACQALPCTSSHSSAWCTQCAYVKGCSGQE